MGIRNSEDRAEQCARALATLDEADWKELVVGLLRSYVDFRQIPKMPRMKNGTGL